MRLNITLTQKGLALVFIPLLMQLMLLGALAWLHSQAEDETLRANHSGRISRAIDQLVRDMFELTSTPRDEMSKFAYSGFMGTANKIRHDITQLKMTVQGDPTEEAIVAKSAQAADKAYNIITWLCHVYAEEGPLSALDGFKRYRPQLRTCVEQMVSNELVSMGQMEEKVEAQSPEIQAQFRHQIKMLIFAVIFISIVLTISVAFLFYNGIVKRLRIMVDNVYRYASKMNLNPVLPLPLGGKDEICELDRTFHQMTYALAEAEQREKNLVEYSLDAIFSIDETLRFRTVSPACEKMFGLTTGKLLGKTIGEVVFNEDLQEVKEALYSTIVRESKTEFEARVLEKSEKIVEVLWSAQWVQEKALLFCVVHDITRRKEAERMRQEVIAMVSHDLRTPLSTISSYFEMLSTGMFGALTERGLHLLQVAESNISRMVNLTNDLLDLEKSKAGMLTIDRKEIGLNDLLEQSLKSVSNLASNQAVHLKMTPTNLTVYADSNRVTQVLVNLLSNAIKFSPKEGEVKIAAEEKEGMAHIYISDQGRGVPEKLKEAIFDRFQQVEIADAVDKGGSGLGLAICKAIVDLHQGDIRVENNAERGSTFSFSLSIVNKALTKK